MKRAPSFNWRVFLTRDASSYTYTDTLQAVQKANDWVTCACGVQCASIPRSPCGCPLDYQLMHLGIDFMQQIRRLHAANSGVTPRQVSACQQRALHTLALIERRASYILATL